MLCSPARKRPEQLSGSSMNTLAGGPSWQLFIPIAMWITLAELEEW